ncbi:hypothetical protein [Afifella pfennigii]|uniref:hypothetical protein n=1 Tax=Afifella pfennigii TaxID=209897 RepID=UPI00047BF528|nr:hypothetical protein [Afifella pfennigii]
MRETFFVARWPEREFQIRRRCARDEDFRAIVSDYDQACAALAHWRQAAEANSEKIREYEEIVKELEAEILERLACAP